MKIRVSERKRAGTIYVAVLGTTLIVALLGMSAIAIQRIQRRSLSLNHDVAQARLNAKTGLRLAMLYIENDPDWRYRSSNGQFSTAISTGNGTFSVSVTDPTDGDLLDDASDPVVLTSSGVSSGAVQNVRLTLLPTTRALDCLEVGLCSGGSLVFNSTTLNCFGTISSNNDISESGNSFILPNVEAANQVNGSDYQQDMQEYAQPRDLPDPTDVFDYYLQKGTAININALPQTTSNLVRNWSFEAGTDEWSHSWETGLTCQQQHVTDEYRSGAGAMKVTQRNSWNDGACYYLTFAVKPEREYQLEAWVKLDSGTEDFRFAFNTKGTQSADVWNTGSWIEVGTNWTKVAADLTPTLWQGDLERAMFKIESKASGSIPDFYVDDVAVVETGPHHRITRQALGAGQNPFGQTNPEGIYIIDCEGKPLLIEHSRIAATLVLIDPGNDSAVGLGPTHWAPATAGYPALLVNGDFRIEPSQAGLNEYEDVVNYNPPAIQSGNLGADSDQNDIFPSQIEGIVYVSGELTLSNEPAFVDSALVVEQNVVADGTIKLTHSGQFLSNPPPGFSGPETIRVLLNSFEKTIHPSP